MDDDNVKKSPQKFKANITDTVANLIPPSLKHITIKKVDKSLPKDMTNTLTSESNDNFKVIRTAPQTTTQLQSATNRNKPRYFVIKKVLKPLTTEKKQNINVTKGMIITKMAESASVNLDHDEMPSNDENEDAVPKPTNGGGIVFGVTNPMVVIEFLLKLKTFPELWRPQLKNCTSVSYELSIKQLCLHLNNRFDLNIQETEIRLSIQRVKIWYSRMLKNIHEHNQNAKTKEPYNHKFPLYFKILNQYLTSGVPHNSNSKVLQSSQFKTITNTNINSNYITDTPISKANVLPGDENVSKKEHPTLKSLLEPSQASKPAANNTPSPANLLKPPQATIPLGTTRASFSKSATPPSSPSPTTQTSLSLDRVDSESRAESLIEFDADTLYENESSDEEVLEIFDERKKCTSKPIDNPDMPKKKRTKTYLGNFGCDLCSKSFKRKCDVRRHRVLHFPPQYECGLCSQRFYFRHWAEKCTHIPKKKFAKHLNVPQENAKELLDEDKIVVTPKRPWPSENDQELEEKDKIIVTPKRSWPKKIFKCRLICELCGASYKQLGSLNCHKRDKHFNQRLKCVVCNFTALTNYRIVQHQKKRHIVEPGTVEEVAKRCRARMDTKTRFSIEARQEFDWRREQRKKLEPGEKFFACCKCRIIFNSRKEKVLHNKMEHPIKDTTVCCLLCLPVKFLLSNSNSARRHYTDIHKVPWDEIDALVKRTKPIYNVLSKEEIELLNASENYKELLEELLKDRDLEPIKKTEPQDDESYKAVQNLPNLTDDSVDYISKVQLEYTQEQPQQQEEENVFVDGIIDHDYNHDYNEELYNDEEYAENNNNNNEHNYSEDQITSNENYVYMADNGQTMYSQQNEVDVKDDAEPDHLAYDMEGNEGNIHQQEPDVGEEYLQNVVDVYVEDGELVYGELVEQSIVVEECVGDLNIEEEYFS